MNKVTTQVTAHCENVTIEGTFPSLYCHGMPEEPQWFFFQCALVLREGKAALNIILVCWSSKWDINRFANPHTIQK